ncbi:MAG: Rv3235 family protein [Actinocrinis sp.]
MLRYGNQDADPRYAGRHTRSPLLTVAGIIDPGRDEDGELGGAAGALRSWVVGWTHRFDPLGTRRTAEPYPAGVRRLVEAVVDVLLERRPADQVRRWTSREVFGLLSTVAQRRAATRFAARSAVRSIRMHVPGPDAVESTVLVQDGPRVRAVALRFERTANCADSAAAPQDGVLQGRFEWRCTALQFA